MSVYYADDQVTLYHGDCREVDEWLSVDALVTDPPYGLGARMAGGRQWASHWGDGLKAVPLPWDAAAPDWLPPLVTNFQQAIVWGGNHFPLPPSRGWLVWDKAVRNFASGHCELAWTNLDQPVKAFTFSRTSLINEGQRENGGPGKWHPTQKPLALMQWCLSFTTGIVADPFAGSGSTLLAARNLGRKAIGVELEERYCELIARRLDQMALDFGAGA